MLFGNYFFDLYGTLVDIRTDEQKPSLWRVAAEYYTLGGAAYTPAGLRARYLALCAEETAALAAAHPELGPDGVEIELRNVFRRLLRKRERPSAASAWPTRRCCSARSPSAARRG